MQELPNNAGKRLAGVMRNDPDNGRSLTRAAGDLQTHRGAAARDAALWQRFGPGRRPRVDGSGRWALRLDRCCLAAGGLGLTRDSSLHAGRRWMRIAGDANSATIVGLGYTNLRHALSIARRTAGF